MKKKSILPILGMVVLLVLILIAINYVRLQKQEKSQFSVNAVTYENLEEDSKIFKNSNMAEKMRAIVVKVDDKSLMAIKTEDRNELISVGFTEEGDIGFAQGQEILIYFDGIVMTTYPEQLSNVGKIEIVKEKSNVQIPDNILRYCYSTHDKVNVTVSELTNRGIALAITDTNDLPYNYSHHYAINHKVKNENYTGIGYKIGEDTESSTSGYTRNRF